MNRGIIIELRSRLDRVDGRSFQLHHNHNHVYGDSLSDELMRLRVVGGPLDLMLSYRLYELHPL